MDSVLVIGATGNIGRELVPLLYRKSVRLRVVSRDLQRLSHLPAGIECVAGDLDDRSAIRSLVAGIDRIFTLAMPGEPDALRNLVEEAEAASVRQVVLISSSAPDDIVIGREHRLSENILIASGLPWTILRPGSLMSNALWWRETIRVRRAVYSPVADIKLAPISPLDVAKTAMTALSDDAHLGKTYTLTGASALSDREKTAILSRVLGLAISCVEIPIAALIEGMKDQGTPEAERFKLGQAFGKIIALGDEPCNPDLERFLGERPQSFEEWCSRHREEFK